MTFALTILGSSSATPTQDRHPTAQLLNVQEQLFLIDCGEGTQMRLLNYKIKRSKLQHIFISHLHGDHCYGLFGLLGTLSLHGRTEPMHIFAPEGLQEMFEVVLKHSAEGAPPPFAIHFHTIDPTKNSLIFENEILTVHTIPMEHRIACTGFLFREKPFIRNIYIEKIAEYAIDYQAIKAIKNGADFFYTLENKWVKNEELTYATLAPRSYAFCSDTRYKPDIIPIIQGVDLLYHEATFLKDSAERAAATCHCTTHQAAEIAKAAKVKRLIIGHFSSRYSNLETHQNEARELFAESYLATEGTVFEVE
ncbi:MAG: hypothetical protein RI894_810 [Bacteroidota bacterium]|jgi:ribonuclease Z